MSPSEKTELVSSTHSHLPVIAYQGGLELLDARWDLRSGRTVKFRVVETPATPMLLHPFTRFVQRRGNRLGARFHVTVVKVGEERATYDGQMMLAGGGSPLGQGYWVKFWLDEDQHHHPFAGFKARNNDEPGDMFMAAFVELDDDETPIDQEQRKRVEEAHGRKPQRLSQYAALLCENPMFHQFLSERVTYKGKQVTSEHWGSNDNAAKWVRYKCHVESRSQLDSDSTAAERFHQLVRKPYTAWRNVNDGD
jgi:hypothetical protein